MESALLVRHPEFWELRDLDLKSTCFSGLQTRAWKVLAQGSKEACEAAARLLGYHVDVICGSDALDHFLASIVPKRWENVKSDRCR